MRSYVYLKAYLEMGKCGQWLAKPTDWRQLST